MRRCSRSRIETRMKTLIIEDDAETAAFITAGLRSHGLAHRGRPKAGADVETRPLEDIIKGIDGVEHNVISPRPKRTSTLRAAAMDPWRTASAAEISSVASQTFRNRRNRAPHRQGRRRPRYLLAARAASP